MIRAAARGHPVTGDVQPVISHCRISGVQDRASNPACGGWGLPQVLYRVADIEPVQQPGVPGRQHPRRLLRGGLADSIRVAAGWRAYVSVLRKTTMVASRSSGWAAKWRSRAASLSSSRQHRIVTSFCGRLGEIDASSFESRLSSVICGSSLPVFERDLQAPPSR